MLACNAFGRIRELATSGNPFTLRSSHLTNPIVQQRFPKSRKDYICVLRFFSYSFTASDGSEGSIAGRVVSPRSIMMHYGFRSKEARRARKQRYRSRQTSHSSLLVARQGDVSRKLNQAFLLVDSFNFNFVDKERSDKCPKNQIQGRVLEQDVCSSLITY